MDTEVVFYAVSIDDKKDKEEVRSIAKKSNWSFDVLLDDKRNLRKELGVRAVPLTLVLKNNKIVYRQVGYVKGDEHKLYKIIQKHSFNRRYSAR